MMSAPASVEESLIPLGGCNAENPGRAHPARGRSFRAWSRLRDSRAGLRLARRSRRYSHCVGLPTSDSVVDSFREALADDGIGYLPGDVESVLVSAPQQPVKQTR